ncbi:MAG: HDIG domain-containing protein [Candidatus Aminicenantes bacterium]|nr:HDIG domain-containing protein [Candidatus Aminicenantes bacterium]
MPLISFKSVRLFKSSPAHPKANGQNGQTPEAGGPPAVRKVVHNPFVLIGAASLLLALFIAYAPTINLPVLKDGEIAPEDIVAPAELVIVNEKTTAAHRAEAEEAVLSVYVLNPNVSLATFDKVRIFFETGRERTKAGGGKDYTKLQKEVFDAFGLEVVTPDLAALDAAAYPADLEAVLASILEKISSPGILNSKSLFTNKESERGFAFIKDQAGEMYARAEDIPDLSEARQRAAAEVEALDLPARRKALLRGLANAFLVPNVFLNKVETESRRAAARDSVEPVPLKIKKGRVVLRKGDEAAPETIKLIEAINLGLKGQRAWVRNFLGTFLLFGLLFVTLWFTLRAVVVPRTAHKIFVMMLLTVAASLAAYKLGLFMASTLSAGSRFFLFQTPDSYTLAFPFQFGVLVFAFLTTNPVALLFALLNSLLAGYLVGTNFFVMIFSLVGGLAAIYGVKLYGRQKRTSILKAGLFVVAPVAIFTGLAIHLVRQKSAAFELLTTEVFMAVLGGVLSAALAFVVLPIYENIFRFVTQTKLLELTDSDSEVLRQLALEAPGSYHHSQTVALLAEKAAETIGLDSLLVKAGALYHDIGKVKMPDYFIENRGRKRDAHRDLTPSMSTLVIVNHVKEGVEIARKEKLPEQVRDMIEQHHGSSVVRFFYLKAKEKYDPELHKIGEESYRYPGPPPQSKEAALVMLADSVEAASRSLRSPKEEHLKRVVRDIFDNYLQDGQLDDCAFSLKELRTIAQSFLATLQTIYQPRVEYPGFEFEGTKKPRKAAKPAAPPEDDGRGSGPPADGSGQGPEV